MTHTIDISFEERRHKSMNKLKSMKYSNTINLQDYKRLETTINRLSSINYIEYDLKAFLRKMKRKIDFDAFYLFPDENHVHMLLVLYDGDIKHFIRKAKDRPYCWDIKVGEFKLDFMDEYLENKAKYIVGKRNVSLYSNIHNYEDITFDFYPNRERIDTFFDKYESMYDYKLHEMGNALREKLSR